MKASAFPPAICNYSGYVLFRESQCVYVCELKLKQAFDNSTDNIKSWLC